MDQPGEPSSLINDKPKLPKIWKMYERVEKIVDSKKVITGRCLKCNEIIKATNSGTSGLHTHARAHHGIEAYKQQKTKGKAKIPVAATKNADTTSSSSILAFNIITHDTLELWLARMTAKDGIPFAKFRTCKDLRECIRTRIETLGLTTNLPDSDSCVKEKVFSFADKAQDLVKEVLREILKAGRFLSLDLDEWTSVSNKRFLNINVFSDDEHVFNLGLVEINGSATSENLLQLVDTRLVLFGLERQRDIIGITTDGASTMLKFGRLSGVTQQLCLAHAIQLAVIDVLYGKPTTGRLANVSCDTLSCEDEIDADIAPEGSDDEGGVDVQDTEIQGDIRNTSISDAITKIRNLGKMFRRSAKATEILLQYVHQKHKKDLKLLLDCKTRWSSLYLMLERYWLIMDCVEKAIIDTGFTINVTPRDKCIIAALLNLLEPVTLTVSALCRREANLLTARASLQLLLNTIKSQNSNLSKSFLNCLTTRIKERWIVESSALLYLKKGLEATKENSIVFQQCTEKYSFACDDEVSVLDSIDFNSSSCTMTDINNLFKLPAKKHITECILKLLNRINGVDACSVDNFECEVEEFEPIPKRMKTYAEILEDALKSASETTITINTSDSSFAGIIAKEMSNFERSNIRGPYLEKCFRMLNTIKPTSVESERCFSIAGYLCCKIRSRMGAKTLDRLCFLKSFFGNKYFFKEVTEKKSDVVDKK